MIASAMCSGVATASLQQPIGALSMAHEDKVGVEMDNELGVGLMPKLLANMFNSPLSASLLDEIEAATAGGAKDSLSNVKSLQQAVSVRSPFDLDRSESGSTVEQGVGELKHEETQPAYCTSEKELDGSSEVKATITLSPVCINTTQLSSQEMAKVWRACVPLDYTLDMGQFITPAIVEHATELMQGETLVLTTTGKVDGVQYERLQALLLAYNSTHQVMTVYSRESHTSSVQHFVLSESLEGEPVLTTEKEHEDVITLLGRVITHYIQAAHTEMQAAEGPPFATVTTDGDVHLQISGNIPYVLPEPTLDDGWRPTTQTANHARLRAHPSAFYPLQQSEVARLSEQEYFDAPLERSFRVYGGQVQAAKVPFIERLGRQEELACDGAVLQVSHTHTPPATRSNGGQVEGVFHTPQDKMLSTQTFTSASSEPLDSPTPAIGLMPSEGERGVQTAATRREATLSYGRLTDHTGEHSSGPEIGRSDGNIRTTPGTMSPVSPCGSTISERGAKVAEAVTQALLTALAAQGVPGQPSAPGHWQELHTNVNRLDTRLGQLEHTTVSQAARHSSELQIQQDKLLLVMEAVDGIMPAIRAYLAPTLQSQTEELQTSLQAGREELQAALEDVRYTLLQKLADMQVTPAMGMPVFGSTRHAMLAGTTTMTHPVLTQPAKRTATMELGSGEPFATRPDGAGGCSGGQPGGSDLGHSKAAAERDSWSRQVGEGQDGPTLRSTRDHGSTRPPPTPPSPGEPSDDGGHSSDGQEEDSDEESDSFRGAPTQRQPRRSRSTREDSGKYSHINNRAVMDHEEKFSGEEATGLKLLLRLNDWTIGYNHKLLLALRPGWEDLTGPAFREICVRATAHMLPATLKGTALTAMQRTVHTKGVVDPRNIPAMVASWILPAHTREDVAQQALSELTLEQGVTKLEHAMYTCIMAKAGMNFGVTPQFTAAQLLEMLSVIRRIAMGQPCHTTIKWMQKAAAPLRNLERGYTAAETSLLQSLVEQCLEEFREMEACRPSAERQYRRPSYQHKHHDQQLSGSRYQEDNGQQGKPTRGLGSTRANLHAMTGGRDQDRKTQEWTTSPATGSLPLKGPAPEDAPEDCRTLMEALLRGGKCFWCMEAGHGRWQCPERRAQRQGN